MNNKKNKYPASEDIKLIIELGTQLWPDRYGEACRYMDQHLASGQAPRTPDAHAIDDTVKWLQWTPDNFFRSDKKHFAKKDLFVITVDNTVIRYRINCHKFSPPRIMQKYKLPSGSKYLYIGAIVDGAGSAYSIGDNARAVFDNLIRHHPDIVYIIKVSSEYCMTTDKFVGVRLSPRRDSEKDVEARLLEASKNPETFYDECMKYVPLESSAVRPDGSVIRSGWEMEWEPTKNAHMFKNKLLLSEMLECTKPHLWEYTRDIVDFNGEPLKSPFGTVDDL